MRPPVRFELRARVRQQLVAPQPEPARPAYTPLPTGVLFLKDRYVRMYEYPTAKEMPLLSLNLTDTSTPFRCIACW